MDLAVEKVKLINWLTEQDEAIIEELIKWKQDHGRVSVAQYNVELDRAESAISNGKFTTHDEAIKRIGSWRDQ
jgi:hypothetical protein